MFVIVIADIIESVGCYYRFLLTSLKLNNPKFDHNNLVYIFSRNKILIVVFNLCQITNNREMRSSFEI